MRILSLLLFLMSIAYIIMPYDCDGTVIGYADDFMFFMSAFCFMYAQFMDRYKIKPIVLLKMLSVVFCFLGAVSLLLLVMFSK